MQGFLRLRPRSVAVLRGHLNLDVKARLRERGESHLHFEVESHSEFASSSLSIAQSGALR